MIKLIATDIDGTLLRSDHTHSAELPALLHSLKENNILFSLASGRPYLTLLNAFNIDTTDVLFIAENGAHVVYRNKPLTIHRMDSETIERLTDTTRKIPKAYSILCTPEGAFVEEDNPDFLEELEKYYFKYTVVPDVTKVQCDIVKYSVCDLAGVEQNSYRHFDDFKSTLQVSLAGPAWLDIMIKGVNKGNAIQELQAALNITEKETMVFGDYLNDLEMMKSAYYSYAMENAHPELFEAARFKAPSNDADGVILKIKEMLNNNLIPLEE
ncbi:MAG TPA: HAD family phosphatase [Clostridiales bacterium]|nr:HAD family phosphatase [Clostridiales bacterium]